MIASRLGLRGLALAAGVALCALAGALALWTAGAGAAEPVSFATYGSGAGQIDDPEGAAVDQSTGDVYVGDRNNFRIDKFSASGEFLLAWGYGVADGTTLALQTCGPEATLPASRCFDGQGANIARGPGAVAPAFVAVEQSTGDVYSFNENNRRVDKFSASGEFLLMFGWHLNETKVQAVNEKEAKGEIPSGAELQAENICTAAEVKVGDACSRGAASSEPGGFGSGSHPIAFGPSGEVWVGDTNRLEQFNSAGEYVSEVEIAGGGETESLAIDSSGDFYVISRKLAGVRKLSAAGVLMETIDSAGSPETLALDSSGDLWVGDKTGPYPSPYRFMEFNGAGVQIEQFGAGEVIGSPRGNSVALSQSGKSLYAASNRSSEAESVAQLFSVPAPGPLIQDQHTEALLPTSVTLAATLNPEGKTTEYHFKYGTSESYGESTATVTLSGSAFEEETVEATLSGLLPETTYHFRLVADDSEGRLSEGEDVTFTTLPAVGVEAEWATDVAAESATIHGELSPLGPAASWWVQYGPSEAYGSVTPEQPLAAGMSPVSVSALIRGLAPASIYHYRFAARDEREGHVYTVHGVDHAILTQFASLTSQLPDGRQWELVSPANKLGAEVELPGEGIAPTRASAGGDALGYLTLGSIEGAPQGSRTPEYAQVLARHGEGGWRSEDVSLPSDSASPVSVGTGSEYQLFSEDLSTAVVAPRSALPLSEEASERTPYLRDNDVQPAGYLPLVTSKEGYADVPAGTEFGGGSPLETNRSAVRLEGATGDLKHIVLTSAVPLEVGAPNYALYEWTAYRLQTVSVLPAGEGSTVASGQLGAGQAMKGRHAISEGGRYVFWSRDNDKALYAWDGVTESSARLDVVQPGVNGVGGAAPVFQGASADGSVVFFTDSQRLTEDASPSGRDLYACEIGEQAGEPTCALRDLTPETTSGEAAAVQGVVSGMSEDGNYVYFVANGVLAPGASPGSCATGTGAEAGQSCNLYLLRRSGGEWQIDFIATLAINDIPDWSGVGQQLVALSAESSPSGSYLAFMSQRSLTGYDNRDGVTGERDEEVYVYHAPAVAGEEGELTCASCDPSGARPDALFDGFVSRLGGTWPINIDPDSTWKEGRLAAVLPDPTTISLDNAITQPRYMLDDGRVLFNGADALVAGDSNGAWDVYEYEPSGTGGCGPSSGGADVSRGEGGCVSLISSGTSGKESAFMEASANGDDIFFMTTAQLSVKDVDSSYDVYDAHVCGSGWQCPVETAASPACTTTASCRAAPSAQPSVFGPPPSATFSGQGNLAPAKAAKVKTKKPVSHERKLARKLKACRGQRGKRRRARCRKRARNSHGTRSRHRKRARNRYDAKSRRKSRSNKGGK